MEITKEMAAKTSPDFDQIIEKTHQALKEFYKGNPEPYIQLFSKRQDVSLAGGFGGISVGPDKVVKNAGMRSSFFRAGENVSFEKVTKFSVEDLGYTVEVERLEVIIGSTGEKIPVALRVTTIFRREDGTWKVVHRHGDLTATRIDPSTYISLAKHHGEVFE